jgi:hypothetical protein
MVALFVTAGIVFWKFGHLSIAAAASLLCWIFLGCLGACVAEQPRPANHILSLEEQGRIRLGTPLRWHGHLRDEPARLPGETDTKRTSELSLKASCYRHKAGCG